MISIPIGDGFVYQPVVKDGIDFFDENILRTLEQIKISDDELRNNYDIKQLSRMTEYGYVYKDDPQDIIYMTGVQEFGNKCYRLTSRTYIPPKYRTGYWKCPDNYRTVKMQMDNISSKYAPNLFFKSREKTNSGGLAISRRLAPEYFGDWIIHPERIELGWKNNWQWILYKNMKGNEYDNITSLQVQG